MPQPRPRQTETCIPTIAIAIAQPHQIFFTRLGYKGTYRFVVISLRRDEVRCPRYGPSLLMFLTKHLDGNTKWIGVNEIKRGTSYEYFVVHGPNFQLENRGITLQISTPSVSQHALCHTQEVYSSILPPQEHIPSLSIHSRSFLTSFKKRYITFPL